MAARAQLEQMRRALPPGMLRRQRADDETGEPTSPAGAGQQRRHVPLRRRRVSVGAGPAGATSDQPEQPDDHHGATRGRRSRPSGVGSATSTSAYSSGGRVAATGLDRAPALRPAARSTLRDVGRGRAARLPPQVLPKNLASAPVDEEDPRPPGRDARRSRRPTDPGRRGDQHRATPGTLALVDAVDLRGVAAHPALLPAGADGVGGRRGDGGGEDRVGLLGVPLDVAGRTQRRQRRGRAPATSADARERQQQGHQRTRGEAGADRAPGHPTGATPGPRHSSQAEDPRPACSATPSSSLAGRHVVGRGRAPSGARWPSRTTCPAHSSIGDVVGHVPEGDHLGRRDAELGAHQRQRGGLGDAGGADLQQRGRRRPGDHRPVAHGLPRPRPRTPAGASSSCRASSLSAGSVEELLDRGPPAARRARRAAPGTPARARSRRDASTAKVAPGHRRADQPADLAGPRAGSQRALAGARSRRGTSQTRAPLEHDRQPVPADVLEHLDPPSAAAGRSRRRRGRRAGPAPRSTSRVRAVTLPSEWTRVPSRSVATRRAPLTRGTSGPARPRHRRRAPMPVTSSAASLDLARPPGPSPRRGRPSAASRCRCGRRRSPARRPRSTPELRRRRARSPEALETPTGRQVEPGGPADDVVGAVQAEPRGELDEVVGRGVRGRG